MSLAVRLFRSDRRCLVLIVPLALVLFSLQLGRRDLWDPDEPRTGVVTREILQGGSWAILHDNGRPYLEKPPLYFWLAAACSLPAHRVTELSLRLPASLAAVLGVVCLFYLGRGLFGRRTGALAAVALATTQDYFMEARWAHPDMLFSFFLCCACLAFHQAHRRDGAFGWLVAFYLAVGLAVLTKGPAGLVLPLAAALVFLMTAGDLRFLRRAGIVWGLPLTLVPVGVWLLAYRASSGASFPLAEALSRFASRVTRGLHHPRPFLHLLTSLPVECLPWALLLPGAVWHTFPRRGSRSDPGTTYLYSWILVFLTLFAVSTEKRGVYLLPLLPLLALLVGRLWDAALFSWEPHPLDRVVFWFLVSALALAGGASLVYLPRIVAEAPGLLRPAVLLAGVTGLAALASLVAHRRAGGGAALSVFSVGLVLCYVVIVLQVLPGLDAHKSARPFCQRVSAAARESPLAIYPDYHAAYVFYAGRRIEVILTRDGLRAFFLSADRAFCLMEEDRYDEERRLLGIDSRIVDRAKIGHRTMLLIESGAARPPAPQGGGGPG